MENEDKNKKGYGELDPFLLNSINHPKDKLILLKLDKELCNFIKDKLKTSLTFPKMNTYQRLLVHKVAHYFGLEHVTNQNSQIVLFKTSFTKIPLLRLFDLVTLDEEKDEKTESKPMFIMKRPDNQNSSKVKQQNIIVNNPIILKKENEGSKKILVKETLKTEVIEENIEKDVGLTIDNEDLADKDLKALKQKELLYIQTRERIFNNEDTDFTLNSESTTFSQTSNQTEQFKRNQMESLYSNKIDKNYIYDYSYDYIRTPNIGKKLYQPYETTNNFNTFPTLDNKYQKNIWNTNNKERTNNKDNIWGNNDWSINTFNYTQKTLYDPSQNTTNSFNINTTQSKLINKMKNLNIDNNKKNLLYEYSATNNYEGVKATDIPTLPTHILKIKRIKKEVEITKIKQEINLEKYKAKIKIENKDVIFLIFPNSFLAQEYLCCFKQLDLSDCFLIEVWQP